MQLILYTISNNHISNKNNTNGCSVSTIIFYVDKELFDVAANTT